MKYEPENRITTLIALSVAVFLYDIFVMIAMPCLSVDLKLLRYMLEKSVNGYTSTVALFWVLQMMEWLNPGILERISEDPKAASNLDCVLVVMCGFVWIYG